jgi:hypothetical protein
MTDRARVTHHGRVYEGELLWLSDYPNYERDEHGRVFRIRRHPQRVTLKLDDASIVHFTIPERVLVVRPVTSFGARGVRDPDANCEAFEPGSPRPNGDCQTDGHYLCDECVHRASCPRGCGGRPSQCKCIACSGCLGGGCSECRGEGIRPRLVWYWLSFADASRPKGEQFLGAAIVGPSLSFIEAIRLAHTLSCNPGGEVQGQVFRGGQIDLIPVSMRGALLTRDDCAEVDRLLREGP